MAENINNTEHTVILHDESLKRFQGGFTSIPNVILENKKISLGARMSYAMLLKYAWQKDFCFPAQERIASDLGVTSRSVRTFLKELRECGLISWKRQGMNRPNVYHILDFPSVVDKQVKKTVENTGVENISGPDRKPASGPDRKQASYEEDSVEEYSINDDVNVNVGKNHKKTSDDGAQNGTTPQEANLTGEKAEYLILSMAEQLGDENVKSRTSFRRILAGLGEPTVWRLLGNTKEAYQDGIVPSAKRAAYFTGMAKNIAKERGVDLGFKNGRKASVASTELNGLRSRVGNRAVVEDARTYP